MKSYIFKQTQNDTDECQLINNKCMQPCICSRTADNDVVREFMCGKIFKWESFVYLTFLDKHLFPAVSAVTYEGTKRLVYHTGRMMSLRSFLTKHDCNTSLILNELFSYTVKFVEKGFVHGNLHIDNIFVEPKGFLTKPKFYTIDYANSFVLNKKRASVPDYNSISFMGHDGIPTRDAYLMYWDIFTLYTSLKIFFKNNMDALTYLENQVQLYIPSNTLKSMLSYFNYPSSYGVFSKFF